MIDGVRRFLGRLKTGHERHYGGFVLAGGLAFLTDATALVVLTKVVGLSPLVARPIGISLAVIVSWLVNRTVTFAMDTPPQLSELARFAAVAWTAQGVNYAIFAAIILAAPGIEPLVALVAACFVSMVVSYTGYRFGVFRKDAQSH